MDVLRFVIGLVLAIVGSVLFLSLVDFGVFAVIFLGVAIVGVVLMIASGFEARLTVGILFLVVDLIIFAEVGPGSGNELVYIPLAVIGLVLTLSAVPESLEPIKWFIFRRGGHQGTVRNLTKESDTMNFWLDGAGKDGASVRVEGMISEGVIEEGDTVWVRGNLNEKGVIRTNEVQRLSKIRASQSLVRKGNAEFSGTAVGGVFRLPPPTLFGGWVALPSRPKFGLRIQRVAADGSPLDIIEAEIMGFNFEGLVLDRDLLKVKGVWQASGRFRILEVENLTSKTKIPI